LKRQGESPKTEDIRIEELDLAGDEALDAVGARAICMPCTVCIICR
jgi:hypothetical protein